MTDYQHFGPPHHLHYLSILYMSLKLSNPSVLDGNSWAISAIQHLNKTLNTIFQVKHKTEDQTHSRKSVATLMMNT
jgi:hypothetical protein